MKSLIISGLSSLILSSFISPVLASELAMTSQFKNFNGSSLGPVNLVSLAQQGFFTDQGIPSHLTLGLQIQSGKIDAKTLVKGAIAAGRLSPDTINDDNYLSQVEFELSQLDLG